MSPDLQLAHARSVNHRDELLASERCGCFYCLRIFPPQAVHEWIDVAPDAVDEIGTTALCPACGIDSVIGSASGLPIEPEFLKAMRSRWFGDS